MRRGAKGRSWRPLVEATDDCSEYAEVRRFLIAQFPRIFDIDDILQEAYLRLLKAQKREEIRCRRAFLCTTARRIALDTLRKRCNSPFVEEIEPVTERVMDGGAAIPDTAGRNEEYALLYEAVATLPDRCRAIFTLVRLKDLSQPEAAARLKLSRHTVENQLVRGIRRCVEFFETRGIRTQHPWREKWLAIQNELTTEERRTQRNEGEP